MRFMLAPRSVKAKHSSIPGKSHGMRNLPGSLDFSGFRALTGATTGSATGETTDSEFGMSKMEELKFFLGIQIHHSPRDPDHVGCLDSRKSTSGGIQFLVLWMRTQLTDYGFHFDKIPMYCDSNAAIAISCNPVKHSHTKHIDVRYHFIKEKVEKGIVELFFVETEYQLADLFTKALPVERFKYLVKRLGMRCLTPAELEALANEST
uniref:Retrovirus-related Pol polyprotein from transposon TNT 1-94 n=1 Tax=Tanacetum cinerariifolium TaxID=118510 RepID=A0A6L2KTT5_TANCI|nr:hypothetical protein [Tanacetum cinerariifolium]